MQSPGCRNRWRLRALAGLAVLANAAAADPASERADMVAFLFKLPAFIEWPDSTFASPTDPFRLCIVGEDPFGALLNTAEGTPAVGKHAIAVQREKTVAPDDHCQEMYIDGDAAFVTQTLAAVSGRPVLTVTDAPAGDKGIVNFVAEQNHVHLQIDQQAALRNHLSISSKLLDLAAAPEGSAP